MELSLVEQGEFFEELRKTMESVRVVYGEDHAFLTDLRCTYHDLGGRNGY
jgi:hypothetical protein